MKGNHSGESVDASVIRLFAQQQFQDVFDLVPPPLRHGDFRFHQADLDRVGVDSAHHRDDLLRVGKAIELNVEIKKRDLVARLIGHRGRRALVTSYRQTGKAQLRRTPAHHPARNFREVLARKQRFQERSRLLGVDDRKRSGIVLMGCEASTETLRAVRSGGPLKADVVHFPDAIGRVAIETAFNHLSGKPVPEREPVRVEIICQEIDAAAGDLGETAPGPMLPLMIVAGLIVVLLVRRWQTGRTGPPRR